MAIPLLVALLVLPTIVHANYYDVLVLDSISPYPAIDSVQIVIKTPNGTVVDTQTTNSSGYAVFTLSTGNYTLVTSKTGYFTDTSTDTIATDPEGNLILLCRNPHPLSYVVGVWDGFTYQAIHGAVVSINYATGGTLSPNVITPQITDGGSVTFGLCDQNIYTITTSKTGYATETYNTSINYNISHNVFLNRTGTTVDLFITPNGILITDTATVTVATYASALPINILIYGVRVGDTLPSYIGIFNQINVSTYQYQLNPSVVGMTAGNYQFRANVTDVFGTTVYSNIANFTIVNVTVTTVPTEPIPAINQTEWQEAGFGWLVPFFTPMLWSVVLSAVISGVVGRLSKHWFMSGIVFLALSGILTVYHVLPDIVGILLVIIGGVVFASGMAKMFGGGGGG